MCIVAVASSLCAFFMHVLICHVSQSFVSFLYLASFEPSSFNISSSTFSKRHWAHIAYLYCHGRPRCSLHVQMFFFRLRLFTSHVLLKDLTADISQVCFHSFRILRAAGGRTNAIICQLASPFVFFVYVARS